MNDPLFSRKVWTIGLSGLGILGLTFSAMRECDPLTGEWRIHRAVQNGKELNTFGWRIFLDIEGDYATLASYWTCGVRHETFAEGVIAKNGNRLDLFERVRMTPELSKTPSGYLNRLPNGLIGYELADADGSIQLEFHRERNAITLLDLLNWR